MKKFLISILLLGICLSLAAQTTPGLRVSGRFLYDHLGEKVILVGVNKMIIWTDIDGVPSFAEIAKTGANCVRIVWLTSGSALQLEAAIYNCRVNNMIPIPELHDATGDWSKLQTCVDYWCRSDIVDVIKRHEQYLIINIANECGQTVTDADYRSGYESAVNQMRTAGIHVPIMIDAASYGQNIDILQANGAYLIDADPDNNMLFSVHMWWPYMYGYTDQDVIDEIAESVSLNFPILVGEFGNKWDETTSGAIPYLLIIDQCTANQVGWIPWEWGPGNNPQTWLDMTTDSTYATLYDWGLQVAVTYANSIKNTAKRPASLTTLGPAPTPAGEIKVQYKCAETGDTASQIKPLVNIINSTPTTVLLNDLKIRYYYTKEGTQVEEFHVDYAVIGSSYVTGAFADGYFEVGFTADAGSLAPGSQTGEIQLRVNKSDYSVYTQSNDYSFDGTVIAYTDWNKITVFRSGELVWGILPEDGTPGPTSEPTTPPGDTAAPTAEPTLPPVDTAAPTDLPATPDPTGIPTDAPSTPAPTDSPTDTPAPTETPAPTTIPTATPAGVTADPTAPATVTPDPTEVPTTPPADTIAPTNPPSETSAPGGCTCANLCSSTTAITVPFTKDGSGEYCYTAASIGSYVNSWNTDAVNVNGTNCTNTYTASSSISAVNGVYYIYLKTSYSWSHLEIK